MRDVTCPLCGVTGPQEQVVPAETLGPPDLDGRPAPMGRYANPWQACGGCGAVARDLAALPAESRDVVASEGYAVTRSSAPSVARLGLCSALIQRGLGHLDAAFWDTLAAAWACDDAGEVEAAREIRRRALLVHQEAQGRVAHHPSESLLLRADLLRRTGRFAEVPACVEQALTATPNPTLAAALERERDLALRGDCGCRRVPPPP